MEYVESTDAFNSDTQNDIEDILYKRSNIYGNFIDLSMIYNQLQVTMEKSGGWDKLQPYQKLALSMIQGKICRILNGDPDYKDNWVDIEGYSKLVSKELV